MTLTRVGSRSRNTLPAWRNVACLGLVALLVTACVTPKQSGVSAPATAPTSVEGLAEAIQMDSQRSDRESDAKVRAQLADEASSYADACLAKAPQAAACLYGRGVASGLQARAHPARAGELLKSMLGSLNSADAADSNYDQAGPSRVRALVLIRAPGWPVGPGDADAGLDSARRAVQLQPSHPPNLLALAEALTKTGDANGAREAYARARTAAQALPATNADRDEWLREADQGLERK
jgi:tetratricopeptide (TPR) repeat protein